MPRTMSIIQDVCVKSPAKFGLSAFPFSPFFLIFDSEKSDSKLGIFAYASSTLETFCNTTRWKIGTCKSFDVECFRGGRVWYFRFD